MGSHKVTTTLSIFVFFFFFFVSMSTATKVCSRAFCSQNEVRFPFRLTERQPDYSCGYPGFELFCDNANETVLNLPYSGKFSVQAISYYRQELWLNDPNNCLPQKLLSFNLSGSPFMGKYYQEFAYYNCSSSRENILKYGILPISCLSGSNYTIYATSSTDTINLLSSSCNLVKVISLPVQRIYHGWSSTLDHDLWLAWDAPNCRQCENLAVQCGFKSKSSHAIKCFSTTSGTSSWVARNAIIVSLGIPMSLIVIGVVYFLFKRVMANIYGRGGATIELTSTIASQRNIITRLDELTLESYPRVVLGESRRLPNPDDDTCSICISEYKPKETLKSIPECNHCFHANCIDQWLRLNPTCPICRNSP